tara:strand:+ start:148 stop:744 length:597 start_codon:yes stop_codon:yes gene_type:complete
MHNQKVVIFIGPQGSGKGTQAKLLKQFLLEHTPDTEVFAVETGQHFRQIMSESGYTSEKIRESINRGDLQPDWLPSWLFVNSFVADYSPGMHVIIDGIPRTVEQAKRVDEVFDYYDISEVEVVLLEVDEELSISRLLSRGRADDNRDAIKHRLEQYQSETKPVIDYFNRHQRYDVHTIDGGEHIEKVTEDIFKAIKLK